MAGIRVKENEPFESAVRRFKRAVEKSGNISEARKRQHHEKRSEKKKRALAAAIKRLRKKTQRDQGRGRTADSFGGRGGARKPSKGRGGKGGPRGSSGGRESEH